MGKNPPHFGILLRKTRTEKGFSLRKFAELVGVSPTYLSLVEKGKVERPPTAERVRRMAELLDESPDQWIALAGRMPEDLAAIIQKQPEAMPELLRAAQGLTAEELRKLADELRKRPGKDGPP
ncbi:MAG: helix-turn-helix domain-containing protein [Phycisphaeraceae bacterium]|nr:MAG: helix-turn-helix domain-containing protein [Phycisphaeraceae bacterium]